ncbi:hypothetical protein TPHA_0A04530 [Tetrapisispora phaffii CBS 4417]|uniref:C2H2-type domain-containing protein n=1 Tax=Tetrapisispora phaffii (strain ATCC 24235 / CBS 4417 / NBRC 1672 / NRRL Y-8282 / UCD 70-5) TaxID=1071381 RepID=G8BNP8_TETPH|nr:hypothetical protein TPHA_0A04530 [Tetrapisispora phaffii CBS 4417]CCE61526.1 hypothetical protein TPHA_0A04530 [Tetrapisispora phaffii CBS 4417]
MSGTNDNNKDNIHFDYSSKENNLTEKGQQQQQDSVYNYTASGNTNFNSYIKQDDRAVNVTPKSNPIELSPANNFSSSTGITNTQNNVTNKSISLPPLSSLNFSHIATVPNENRPSIAVADTINQSPLSRSRLYDQPDPPPPMASHIGISPIIHSLPNGVYNNVNHSYYLNKQLPIKQLPGTNQNVAIGYDPNYGRQYNQLNNVYPDNKLGNPAYAIQTHAVMTNNKVFNVNTSKLTYEETGYHLRQNATEQQYVPHANYNNPTRAFTMDNSNTASSIGNNDVIYHGRPELSASVTNHEQIVPQNLPKLNYYDMNKINKQCDNSNRDNIERVQAIETFSKNIVLPKPEIGILQNTVAYDRNNTLSMNSDIIQRASSDLEPGVVTNNNNTSIVDLTKLNSITKDNVSLSKLPITDRKGKKKKKKRAIHQCPICNRVTTRSYSLHAHMLVHTKDKPFKCEWQDCGKAFSIKSNLSRHMKIHIHKQKKLNKETRETNDTTNNDTY